MGNVRASRCGTSNKYRLSRFFHATTKANEVSPAANRSMFRQILLILLLPLSTFGFAEQQTAVLHRGEEIFLYYGPDSFNEACISAMDGDAIVLSTGTFNSCDINKSITIFGTYAFSDDGTKSSIIDNVTINSNHVEIKGIRFNSLTIRGVSHFSISNCYITHLKAEAGDYSKYHDYTSIDNCFIDSFEAMELSRDLSLYNCNINYFLDSNTIDNKANITHCAIALLKRLEGRSPDVNSIKYHYCQPTANFQSCLLGLYSNCDYIDKANTKYPLVPQISFNSSSEFIDCMFFETNYFSSSSEHAANWVINFNNCYTENLGYRYFYNVSSYTDVLAYNSIGYAYSIYGPILFKYYPDTPDFGSPITDIDADSYLVSSASMVRLNWKEKSNDNMGDYNIYYSKDNGPYMLWLPDTKLTTATFKGEKGSIYLFTVTGRDAFGNREVFDETKCVSVKFE